MKYLLVAILAAIVCSCGPRRPLQVLPSAEQVELLEMREKNKRLAAEVAAMRKIFKEAGTYSRSPRSKEK